ncbi:MAG: 3-deoxy-D-manno-octulosonic acid transferase [Desulfobacterales bacterium]|nr:3-deoxy-D-manno-octulosonic acid transferase [Desulfobacterales bacterium]
MNILTNLYILISSVLFLLGFPVFWIYARLTGRYTRHLKERLGLIPQKTLQGLSGSPRIWIHAVSLGEMKVAASIIEVIRRIMPSSSILVSTTTEHGRKMAEETFKGVIPVVYSPIDFLGSICKALSSVRPDVMVFLETELWPAWLFVAHRMGVKVALINGRISVRSINRYLKLRPFFREVLNNFDVFSMITEEDAARATAMGADRKKIEINGNAKYDLLKSVANRSMKTEIRRILDLNAARVFIAGSTRRGEEAMVLDAYGKILEKFPDTILIIAPRHIKRAPDIVSLVKSHGLGYQLRTDLGENKSSRTEQVIILDTFGELFNFYSVGNIVFSGGSLVPLGGQNPLEPAVWGNVIFYGPFMDSFPDAKALLEEAEAGVMVDGPDMLAQKALWFFDHPDAQSAYGARAREAVITNTAAV